MYFFNYVISSLRIEKLLTSRRDHLLCKKAALDGLFPKKLRLIKLKGKWEKLAIFVDSLRGHTLPFVSF